MLHYERTVCTGQTSLLAGRLAGWSEVKGEKRGEVYVCVVIGLSVGEETKRQPESIDLLS